MPTELSFLDAAYPLSEYPAGIDGLAFYIGGDTPHVWTVAEETACPYQYRLPIWVRSDPQDVTASGDILAILPQLKEFEVPLGSLVALDSETSVNPGYVAGIYAGLKAAGYTLIDYGSVSTVFGNKNPDGYYWGADWTNVPHIYPGSVMTQYISFAAYDESEAQLVLPFWKKGTTAVETTGIQNGWAFCVKCGSLFYLAAAHNVCAAGDAHSAPPGDSYDYSLLHD